MVVHNKTFMNIVKDYYKTLTHSFIKVLHKSQEFPLFLAGIPDKSYSTFDGLEAWSTASFILKRMRPCLSISSTLTLTI